MPKYQDQRSLATIFARGPSTGPETLCFASGGSWSWHLWCSRHRRQPHGFGLFASIGLAATSHLAQWSIPPLALFELFRWQAWLTLIMDFILAIIGVFLVHEAVPNLVPSACNENYSLSIWANVIGAMAFGLLGCFLGGQKIDHRHVLTLVAFFWVAPFVGFFYGPWYAAQTLLSGCQSIAVSAVCKSP